jgi:alanine racemase
VRDLPAGATIGYGRTHTLTRPSRIATLAAGYADGLSRRLSNIGHVLLHGRRVPLVGRVSMDQCQVDVTNVPSVQTGDVATIIGQDGAERQSVLDLAQLLDTTPHEPTCALSRRVARRYQSDGGDQ